MSELRKEAAALEKAIIDTVQQVKPLTPTEEDQLKEWRRKLALIKQKLGVVLTSSERLHVVSDSTAPKASGVADPNALLRFSNDSQQGVAFQSDGH